ncbi:MAG: glycosyltransferase [Candidatus Marinimicrobia bacterium]|nr:glycosyltransferase [Candidatus Neomarinimicrobiota bacterium]
MINISVIIPVYNRASTISRAIDSVLNQSYRVFEIIVVDDGSTDKTGEILKTYSDKIKIISQKNSGVSSARNIGILNSRGNWISLLDSDDEWLPNKLQLEVDYINKNPDMKILQTEEKWIRNGKQINPKKYHTKNDGYFFEKSLELCLVSPSAVIFKRELFDEIGVFDKDLPVCEDYDYWLRVGLKYPIGLVKEFGIIKYGGHSDQLSHKYWGMDRFRIQSLEKLLARELAPLSKDKTGKIKVIAREQAPLSEKRKLVLKSIIKKLEILLIGAKKREKNVAELIKKIEKYNDELNYLN